MHLTREEIRSVLTAGENNAASDHLASCKTCDAAANEISLEIALDEPLAWELAELPEIPRDVLPGELETYASECIARAIPASELIADPRLTSEDGLLALLRASHSLLNVDPSRLLGITDAALVAPRSEAVAVIALRERANALRRLGELPECLVSIERGRAIARRLVVSEHELAIFDYIEAMVLVDQSLPLKARQLAMPALATFVRFGDQRRALYARMLLGFIDYETCEFESARRHFQAQVEPLAEIGDSASSIGALQNAAYCSLQLKELDVARRDLLAARTGYSDLGLTTEVLRVRWLLARLAVENREFAEAEPELIVVANEFDTMSLRLDAALVRLELVELLQRDDRAGEAVELTRSLASVFASTGARGRLADAMTILRESTEQGWSLDEPLREARDAISELIAVPMHFSR